MRMALIAPVPTSIPIKVACATPLSPPNRDYGLFPRASPIVFLAWKESGHRASSIKSRGMSALGGSMRDRSLAMSLRNLVAGAAVGIAIASLAGTAHAQSKIAVITPYLAQPGTQFYVEGFQAAAKDKGWDVNVIDTKGDVAAVISRIEDV